MGTTRAKVSFCDAPACGKAEVWPEVIDKVEKPFGYFLKVEAVLDNGVWTYPVYACTVEHIGPAVEAGEKRAQENHVGTW